MPQKIYCQEDVRNAIQNVSKRINELRLNVKTHVLVSRPQGILVHTRLQAMFNVKFDDPIEQVISEIIVAHATKAEKLGPGGFDACLEKLLEKLEAFLSGNNHKQTDVILSDIVGPGAMAPTTSDAAWVLNKYMINADKRSRSMLLQALELAGFAGRIIVEKTEAAPSVELVRGYTFEQSPAWPISVRLEKPRVVCIDGFVESISELHRLLEAASEAKEPVLLFLRGLTEDVKHTLKVNYDRGSLRVIPVIVKFDTQGINAINDISIACGADLINSNKGDVISNVDLAGAARIYEAIVYPTKVVIMSTETRRAVETQVAFLRNKRNDEKIEDVAELFDMRIKSLSPNHVVVRIPDDKDYVTSAQSIDYALRAIKALVDYGTITTNNKKILTVTAISSKVHASRCFETLTSLGSVITS